MLSNPYHTISFDVGPLEADIITKLAERAYGMAKEFRMPCNLRKQMEYQMDITAVHANGCPLKLQELLDADNFNFAHDVFGIERHLNRVTGQLEDCFLPRYADVALMKDQAA